jgi:hypothetical protein
MAAQIPSEEVPIDYMGEMERLSLAMDALMILTSFGVPQDVQELLVRGDAMHGVRPGALSAAIAHIIQAERRHWGAMMDALGALGIGA